MKTGRCKYTQPIYIRAERGLRDAALRAAKLQGVSLSEMIRLQLRSIVAAGRPSAAQTDARP